MPPVSSPGLHERRGAGGRPEPDRAARVRFRRAVALMLMTLVIPGSAQLVAGTKEVGRIAIRIWLVLVGVGVFVLLLGVVWHGFVYQLLESDFLLGVLRLTLMVVAVGWALLFIDAWRLGQPLTLVRNQRLGLVGLNGILCFGVAGSLLFGAHIVSSGQVLLALFPDGNASAPSHGRYNVLLLGGDSGAGRFGLRPDSMTVASIDEDTGRTVLIGLPRNLSNFSFKEGSVMEEQFPDGFDCTDCYLNGVATWAGDNKELFPKSKHPGVDATIQAIEGITDLKINYWVLVDLQGFKDVVDAVGGVTLNVRSKIPVGLPCENHFHYIEAGQEEAERPRHPLVRPRPRGLRRLLADGAAEVRAQRDAHPDQPAERTAQLRSHRQGDHGHGEDQPPPQRDRHVHRPGREVARTRRSPRSPWCRR